MLMPMAGMGTDVVFSNKSDFGDKDIVHLKRLGGLSGVDLSDTRVTDRRLADLATMKELKGLILNRTAVTDAGLRHLGKLEKLEVLSLFPLPANALRDAAEGRERVVVVEENAPGLYAREVRALLQGIEVRQVNAPGAMVTPAAVREAVRW